MKTVRERKELQFLIHSESKICICSGRNETGRTFMYPWVVFFYVIRNTYSLTVYVVAILLYARHVFR